MGKSQTDKLAHHLRGLREDHEFTIAVLAQRSGVSKSTLSRIENGDVSPTAETLGKLASAYAMPISHLLTPLERGFQPLFRRGDQPIWRDPDHAFVRRNVSPPHGELSLELIESRLGEDQHIEYDAPAVPGQEHHILILSGRMNVTVEGKTFDLKKGDCLRYRLFGNTVFKTSNTSCRYLIALS